jgi:hypothetical protein
MLANVASGLRDAFAARGCPADVFVGEQYSHDHADGLRVVLVPTSDQYGPRDASTSGTATAPTINRLNPRALMTRMVSCRAELWAPTPNPEEQSDIVASDYETMDALVNCTLACLAGVALGVYEIGGGEYINEKAVHARRGIAYHLTFSVACPIIDVKFPPLRQTTYDAGSMAAEISITGQLPADTTLVEFEVDPAAE